MIITDLIYIGKFLGKLLTRSLLAEHTVQILCMRMEWYSNVDCRKLLLCRMAWTVLIDTAGSTYISSPNTYVNKQAHLSTIRGTVRCYWQNDILNYDDSSMRTNTKTNNNITNSWSVITPCTPETPSKLPESNIILMRSLWRRGIISNRYFIRVNSRTKVIWVKSGCREESLVNLSKKKWRRALY